MTLIFSPFGGNRLSAKERQIVQEIIRHNKNLTRTVLASPLHELLDCSLNGWLKTVEYLQFLESLHQCGILTLPHIFCGLPALFYQPARAGLPATLIARLESGGYRTLQRGGSLCLRNLVRSTAKAQSAGFYIRCQRRRCDAVYTNSHQPDNCADVQRCNGFSVAGNCATYRRPGSRDVRHPLYGSAVRRCVSGAQLGQYRSRRGGDKVRTKSRRVIDT